MPPRSLLRQLVEDHLLVDAIEQFGPQLLLEQFGDVRLDHGIGFVVPPIGVLAGLAYLLLADGFGGGRSVGKPGSSGSRPSCPVPGTRQRFRESIIRNLPCGLAQLAFEIACVGWIGSGAVLSLEGLLVIGNEQGRRLGDEIAKTQVLESGQLDVSD